MAKKKTKNKSRRRILTLGLLSLLVIAGTTFTIGKYWVDIISKYKEKQKLDKELKIMKEKEETLRADATKLQDPDYIARYAREKYLYSKDGEFILRIK